MFRLRLGDAAAQRRLIVYAALPLTYVVSGRLGLFLAVPPGYATAVFLPAGIAVAAMFTVGAASLPATLLASFLLNIWIGYSLGHSLDSQHIAAAVIIAVASACQAAVGGSALRRAIGYPALLDNLRDLSLFLLLAPVICVTSATLALAGMWALGVVQIADLPNNWMTWWVGDTLGVILALPLVLVLVGEPRTLWHSRARFVATPMVLCFTAFVAIFIRVSGWEQEQALLEFRMRSQGLADSIKANLEEQSLFLEQLSSTFATRRLPITRQNFRDLVQKLVRRFPSVQAIEWAPLVAPADRPAFEAAQHAEFSDFAIRERDPSGRLRPEGESDRFYPVTYLEPLNGNENAVGFDLSSDPDRRSAIEAAIKSGNVTATAPIRLVQEPGQQAGILLLAAVPAGPSGPGIVLVALRMGTFAAALADPLASTLNLRFVDSAGSQSLFNGFPKLTGVAYEAAFNLGTRRYVIQTAPSATYVAGHRGWQSWGVLAAGTLGTGLLGAFLLLGTGHTYRLKRLADELRENEERMRIAQQAANWGVFEYDYKTGRDQWSPEVEALYGLKPGMFEGTDEGWSRRIHPEDRERMESAMERALGSGEYAEDFRVMWDDGSVHWLFARARVFRDADGTPRRMLGVNVDITQRKHAEDQLRAGKAQLESVVNRTPFMLARCSRDLRYLFVSEACAEMLGRRPEDIVGKPIIEVVGAEGFQAIRQHVERVLAGERVEYEGEINYEGVGVRFVHVVYTPEKDQTGCVIGWVASILDLTERKQAEMQRDLLVAEVNHRVKNALATVVAIARRSFSRNRPLDEAQRSFNSRIRALAQTHTRLAEANWSGISLETTILDEIAPYRTADNVLLSGPAITLTPKCAVSLGMAIHELTTNAAKYGALSTKNGSIQVTWQIALPQNEVRIHWLESSGPAADAPNQGGFGRWLLEQALASDLNGSVTLDFRHEGLSCRIRFPLAQHRMADGEGAAPMAGTSLSNGVPSGPIPSMPADPAGSTDIDHSNGARVLIVEDEGLLALQIVDIFQSAGSTVIGPFSDLTRARNAVRHEAVDFAVLDTNLNGEPVYPLADELSASGIPFVFVTGYEASNLPERFRASPRVSKPFDPADLTKQLKRAGTRG